MATRRDFLVAGASTVALMTVSGMGLAGERPFDGAGPGDGGPPPDAGEKGMGGQGPDDNIEAIRSVVAMTEVFGDGLRWTGVALEYHQVISKASLSADTFSVEGRRVLKVYTNTLPEPAETPVDGTWVIVALDANEQAGRLYSSQQRNATRTPQDVSVTQTGPVTTTLGTVIKADEQPRSANVTHTPIVDQFQQRAFTDPETGRVLNYNLFLPAGFDPAKRYPLVLFMHDAGTTSAVTDTTLIQGLGAVVWARPEEQCKRPCVVLAPQYNEQVVNDQSETTDALETTVHLVRTLCETCQLDTRRLYATGQSGGAMMTIAMNIRYPDLFAASFIVAGQWDAALVTPLANDHLWVMVSQGDERAWPGENAMMAMLAQEGAQIERAVWNGRAADEEMQTSVAAMRQVGAPINYVALEKGTVVPEGEEDTPVANHMNTWVIAYQIEGIREWLFEQRLPG